MFFGKGTGMNFSVWKHTSCLGIQDGYKIVTKLHSLHKIVGVSIHWLKAFQQYLEGN